MSQVENPEHYQGAAAIARPALLALRIPEAALDMECIEAIEQHYSTALENAYLFSAIKYLWRCGAKDDLMIDLLKAQWYLRRCLNRPERGLCRIWAWVELNRMQACITEVNRLLNKIGTEGGNGESDRPPT